VKILFLYCAQAELANRQSYGFHPLKTASSTLRGAIFKECDILLRLFQELTGRFDRHNLGFIDTSGPKQISQFRSDLEAQLHTPLAVSSDPPKKFVTRGWNSMLTTLQQIERLAKAFQDSNSDPGHTPLNCLILGETGTGKEHIASMLHHEDTMAHPFQVLDCTSIPTPLLESELWGFKKGSFTDATEEREGLVASARNGTLFVDEIGLTDQTFQAKLLRFIETRSYRRLGENKISTVERCQVIAATSRNLEEEAKKGTFLPDLFYRIAAITITVPPLRERREDIPLLLGRFGREHGVTFTTDTLAILMDYDWPGNVRELKQVIERCAVLGDHREITPADLPSRITKPYQGVPEFDDRLREIRVRRSRGGHRDGHETQSAARREQILAAMAEARGNKSVAAGILGVGRRDLYREFKVQGIDPKEFSTEHE
jgi:DNA-binding NtrC family response regulator